MKIYKIVHRDKFNRQLSAIISFDNEVSINDILTTIEEEYDSIVEELVFIGKQEGLYLPIARGVGYPYYAIKVFEID